MFGVTERESLTVGSQAQARLKYHNLWESCFGIYRGQILVYLLTLVDKTRLMLLMTVGYWSEEVVRGAAVKDRAALLDPDTRDDKDEHESVSRAIGKTNTCVVIVFCAAHPGPCTSQSPPQHGVAVLSGYRDSRKAWRGPERIPAAARATTQEQRDKRLATLARCRARHV